MTADAVAGSIALIGFGLDSLVEMSSGLVILWQFLHPVPESRERMALRPIGLSFFALAIYISVESVRNLIGGGEPAPSPVGIALAAPKPAPGTVLAFPLAHLWFLYVLLGLYILLLAVRSLMLALPVRGRGLSVAKLRSRPVAC